MKKLILSMLIVLGTIASTQAQTFDFSCRSQISDAGFTQEQLTIDLVGFEISDDGLALQMDSVDHGGGIGVNQMSFTYSETGFLVEVETGVPMRFNYHLVGHLPVVGGGSAYSNDLAELIALVAFDADADDDSDGFTNGEERYLQSSTNPVLADNDGTYSYIKNDVEIFITPLGSNSFRIHDELGIYLVANTSGGVSSAVYYARTLGLDESYVDVTDTDDDGFTDLEEELLASYVIVTDDNSGATSPMFADNEGQYQIETSNYDGGYIIIEPVGSQFHVYDEDEVVSEYWDTLQEAIDAALAYANA